MKSKQTSTKEEVKEWLSSVEGLRMYDELGALSLYHHDMVRKILFDPLIERRGGERPN